MFFHVTKGLQRSGTALCWAHQMLKDTLKFSNRHTSLFLTLYLIRPKPLTTNSAMCSTAVGLSKLLVNISIGKQEKLVTLVT